MFKKTIVATLVLLLLLSLGGCAGARDTFDTVNLFARYECWSSGTSTHSYVVEHYTNGDIFLIARPYEGYDYGEPYACVKLTQTPQQLEDMLAALRDAKFARLRPDVGVLSADGASYEITILSDRRTVTSGGLNPQDKRFLRVAGIVGLKDDYAARIDAAFSDYIFANETQNRPGPPYTFEGVSLFARCEMRAPEGPYAYGVDAAYYADGRVVLTARPYADDFGTPYASVTLEQTPEQVDAMQCALGEFELDELESSADVFALDGVDYSIAVYTAGHMFSAWSSNPKDELFLHVLDVIGPPNDALELLREPFDEYVAAHAASGDE